MKKFLTNSIYACLLVLVILPTSHVWAQINCAELNLVEAISLEDEVTVDTFIYARKFNQSSMDTQNLCLSIYSHGLDAINSDRPLVMISHGGSFIGGQKENMDEVARRFASRGYIAVTHDYRLTSQEALASNPFNAINLFYETATNATEDLVDAANFAKSKSADYNIDTNFVVYAGGSAGAIMALHLAYVDKDDEIVGPIQPIFEEHSTLISDNSDKDGIVAVVNLSGAILDSNWLKNNDVPVFSFHGDQDGTVPYDAGLALGLIPMSGSEVIHRILDEQGVQNSLTTVEGGGHSNIYTDEVYAPLLDSFIANTIIDLSALICNSVTSTFELRPGQVVSVYPNPFVREITISDVEAGDRIALRDLLGRIVYFEEITVTAQNWNIAVDSNLKSGIYLLSMESREGIRQTKKLIKVE